MLETAASGHQGVHYRSILEMMYSQVNGWRQLSFVSHQIVGISIAIIAFYKFAFKQLSRH